MNTKVFVLCHIILNFYFITALEIGEECVPNNSVSKGTCTEVSKCDEAMRSIRNKNYHQFQRCGFNGDEEIVCCPQTYNRFGTTEKPSTNLRKVDIECRKLLQRSIPALVLHIIGGEVASLGEFPHMAAIGFDRGEGYSFDCGGSLISSTYVVTAAHCIDTLDKIRPEIIRVGVVDLNGSEFDERTDYRIADIQMYPEYKRREKYHDIALLRLDRQVALSSSVSPACVHSNAADPREPLTITGWGATSTSTEARSKTLLKANVTAVERGTCSQSYSSWRKLPQGIAAGQICAGDPEGAHDACQGDSGGPLQALGADGAWRLVGVTSFGRGCGNPVPGVYTRLAAYLDWIEAAVWP